jgi:hypothetical protein
MFYSSFTTWGLVSALSETTSSSARPARYPREVKAAIRENKSAILARMRPGCDVEHLLLDHPPATREELVLLMEQLADPQAFARWLEHVMERVE